MPTELTPEQQELVRKYKGLAVQAAFYAHKRCGGVIGEDELVGIGYLAMVEAALRYDRTKGHYVPFAKIRVRGAMQDALRRKRPEGLDPGADAEGKPIALDELLDPTTTLSTKFVQADLRRAAMELVDELPEAERDLVQAIYIDEVEQQKYAERIGVHRNTVKNMLDRVLPTLLARLAREKPDDDGGD